jgi:type IV secretion system protein VirB3
MGLGDFWWVIIMESEKLEKFATYNGLARVALMYGIPIIPLISLCIAALFTGVIGIMLVGVIKGLVLPIICMAMLFGIRVMCLDDSRAIEALTWDIKGALTRVICRSTVTSYTSINETKSKRKDVIREFYKQH